MRFSKFLLSIPALAVLALASADAATLLTQINAPNRSDFTGTVGIVFTVTGANNLSVTSLGFQDSADNGLASAHQVGLWDSAGNLLVSVTVPIGTGGTLVDHYRYGASFAAVTLVAGQQYTIGAAVNTSDAWTDSGSSAAVSMSNAVPSGLGAVYLGGGFARPTTDGTLNDLRWGPGNLQYAVVPEPAAALLGSLGLLGLLLRRR